jgi:hypothetical protein
MPATVTVRLSPDAVWMESESPTARLWSSAYVSVTSAPSPASLPSAALEPSVQSNV